MSRFAGRVIELRLRGHVRFGAGAIGQLPELVHETGCRRAFVVTDPGVVRAGVLERVQGLLEAAGIDVGSFGDVEANPGTATVVRGSDALLAFGAEDSVVIGLGGGSSMDTAKVVALHAVNGGDILALGYHREDLAPGRPLIAVPTTAGTGAETNTYGVITDEVAGRKDYLGHPSLLPAWAVLDPELTVGVPPSATAATGIDAMTHAIESLLSRHPNPFAEALALGVIRTVAEWLPRAVADGADIHARSELLMAAHLAGVAQQSGTGVGLVHALGHGIGTRARLPHGTALAAVLPEVLAFYADRPGLRDRELALLGVAMRVASPTEDPATGAIAAIGGLRTFLGSLGQRPGLHHLGLDHALLDTVAEDAIGDPAIANSPALPSVVEARAILASAAG